MGEQRQIRTRSWNRMPTKRCSANGTMEEFIVVDDDEVIILDFPESSKYKASGGTSSTGNECIMQRVISIDDDDEEEDKENVYKAEGSTSNRNSLGTNLHTSADVDDDDCQFVQEKCAAFRFSKCKQTFSTIPSSGIRFGLGSEFESDFSDSDCSDCEILEGSQGQVREQWEKAFSRKLKKSGKAGLSEEEAGPSDFPRDPDFGPCFESRTEKHDQTSFFFPARNRDGGTETFSTSFGTDYRSPNTSLFGSEMEEENRAKKFGYSRFFSKEDDIPGPSSLSPELQVERETCYSPSTHFTSSKEQIHQNGFKEVEKEPDRVRVPCESSQSTKEKQKKKAAYWSYTIVEEEDASKSSPSKTSDGNGDTMSVLDNQSNEGSCKDGISSFGESREPTIGPIPSTSGQVQGINGTAPAIDIMLDREKLKETDEYKKAQEEEWESRQQQLQIQKEEAQRLRKRRKLENTRQLEMERRQKERVEEVRETQKKDEESMNMKEKFRAEITKSLKLLELKCINMASLLRGLGIHVGGGASPLPNEVHAAYKRAVLKFHPDRASRGDIKQQVEAEEKFKLIARMKDKFKSGSLF